MNLWILSVFGGGRRCSVASFHRLGIDGPTNGIASAATVAICGFPIVFKTTKGVRVGSSENVAKESFYPRWLKRSGVLSNKMRTGCTTVKLSQTLSTQTFAHLSRGTFVLFFHCFSLYFFIFLARQKARCSFGVYGLPDRRLSGSVVVISSTVFSSEKSLFSSVV